MLVNANVEDLMVVGLTENILNNELEFNSLLEEMSRQPEYFQFREEARPPRAPHEAGPGRRR